MSRLAQALYPALCATASASQPETDSLRVSPVEANRRRRNVRSRSAFAMVAAILLASLTVGGCGGDASSSIAPPPPPSQPAPANLQGTWVTTLPGSGERVTLTLGALSYRIVRGANEASGVIAVSGDRIEFSGSTACAGIGAYRWSITNSSLLFNTLATDACPGRSEVVAGITYTRSV